MKLNVKGLVFVGFAAAVFASAARADVPTGTNGAKTVTSVNFTEATYEKLDNKVNAFTEANKNSTTNYPSNAAVTAALAANGGSVENSEIDIKVNGTSAGTFTVNQANDGEVNISAVTGITQGGQPVTVTAGVAALPADANTQYTFTSGTTAGGFVVNDGTTDTPVAVYHAQTTDNLVTTLTGADDSHYPSAKAVADALQDVESHDDNTQYTFTSGTTAGGFVVNDGTTDTPVAVYHAQTTDNLVTTLTGADDSHYPSAKAVADALPTVNDATLTIQKNGATIDTFTANSATAKTINITVPTAPDIPTPAANTCTAAAPCALVWAGDAPTWEPIQQQ